MKYWFQKLWFSWTHPHLVRGLYDKDYDERMKLYTESEDYVFKINDIIKKKQYFYTFSIIRKSDGKDVLDGGEVWIANGRWSAGMAYRLSQGLSHTRPSKLTIYNMFQKLWKSMTPDQKLVYNNNFNNLYKGCN